MTNVQEITVAIDDKPPFEYIISKEGEADSRIIKVGFIENNIEYKIPANTTAKIKIYKPDGNKILTDCTITDNKVVCTLSEQMLSAAGVGKGEILLYNNSSVLISATFYIKIVESVYKNHTLISDNDYFSLNKIMIETIQVRESLENAYKIAETQGEKASEAADKANTAATAASMVSCAVPLRQPMPTRNTLGVRRSVSANGSFVQNPITFPSAPCIFSTIPPGNAPLIGKSLTSGTSCSKISAATYFASGMLEMAQPFFAAQASTANLPSPSVAVVMTADAPSAAARRRARSFAPPI